MPSPGDDCSNCFFAFAIPANAGIAPSGKYSCNFNAPLPKASDEGWLWPIVQGDWWCGEGINSISGCSYDAPVRPPTPGGTTSNGTFTMTTQSTKNVVDTACTPSSNVKVWNINATYDAPALGVPTPVAIAGSGSFDVMVNDNCTGDFGYTIYN